MKKSIQEETLERRRLLKTALAAAVATPLSASVAPSAQAGIRQLSYVREYVTPQNMNFVFEWTDIMLQATRDAFTPPPPAARAFAMAHVAAFNAYNGIAGRYADTMGYGQGPQGGNPEAAYHVAMDIVLSDAFQRPFWPERRRMLRNIPDGNAKTLGIQWGKEVGRRMVRTRSKDGVGDHGTTTQFGSYKKRFNPMSWEPTLPQYNSGVGPRVEPYTRGLFPSWGEITPFGVNNIKSFRADRFPHPRSQRFIDDYNKVRMLGSTDSTIRTDDQSQIAFFWEDGAGGATPPGRFMILATQLLQGRMDTYALARAMCFVAMAVGDAGIAAWDSKYFYDIVRPETMYRKRAFHPEIRNAAMPPAPSWQALILTPPFPAYTSGHSTFGAAGARAVWNALGTNLINYTMEPVDLAWWPDQLKDVRRSYTTIWQAAEENGLSRLYGGVHWTFDHEEGMRVGRELADAAFAAHFPQIRA